MPIIDNLKSIANTLREADKTEEYNQILSAQQKLLDMQDEIQQLTKEKRELEERLKIEDTLEYDNKNDVYRKEDTENEVFCPPCWEVRNNLVHMSANKNNDVWTCPECDHYAGQGRYNRNSNIGGGATKTSYE